MPLRALFHVRLPQDDGLLGRFAVAAIVHQPGAYVGTVVAEWERAVGLRHSRAGDGAVPSMMRFNRQTPYGAPAATAQGVAAYYHRAYSSIRVLPLPKWGHRLGRYQSIVRLHELLVLPLLLVALAGAFVTIGPTRTGISLLLGFALTLYMVPPIVAMWDVRFGVLPGELLSVAAAVGAWGVFVHMNGRTGRTG